MRTKKAQQKTDRIVQQLQDHVRPGGEHHDVLNVSKDLLQVGVREGEHLDLVLVVDEAVTLLTQPVYGDGRGQEGQ